MPEKTMALNTYNYSIFNDYLFEVGKGRNYLEEKNAYFRILNSCPPPAGEFRASNFEITFVKSVRNSMTSSIFILITREGFRTIE